MVTKVDVCSLDNTSASDAMGKASTYHLMIASCQLVEIKLRWFTTFNGEHVLCQSLQLTYVPTSPTLTKYVLLLRVKHQGLFYYLGEASRFILPFKVKHHSTLLAYFPYLGNFILFT